MSKPLAPIEPISSSSSFDIDDDEGWQEMPVVRTDNSASGMDEEDQKKYHYRASGTDASGHATSSTTTANATGHHIDYDSQGRAWREKSEQNEGDYTRLRFTEEEDTDEVHLRTRYLFDEDKAMTPLSQMQATKNLLTEGQRIAYVGLCALTAREMVMKLKGAERKELKKAIADMEVWVLKIMSRLYYHMEILPPEQKMIESLAEHGVEPMDLTPTLLTTHTVANPEYDPAEAKRQEAEDHFNPPPAYSPNPSDSNPSDFKSDTKLPSSPPTSPTVTSPAPYQTTTRVLQETTTTIPGLTTSLSATSASLTLDIRWTVLCDLFLVLIADSVYDARSRVLLESVASKLGLGWFDLVKFESRVTEALEIQEDVDRMENHDVVVERQQAAKKKRYMMMGIATLGGGLVIGLSAGLLAPVIAGGLGPRTVGPSES